MVRLCNGLGEALLLVGLDEGLREGEAFLPMHWTDSQCSQGRSTASSPRGGSPFRPADVQTGAGAGQGAAHPLARALVWPG